MITLISITKDINILEALAKRITPTSAVQTGYTSLNQTYMVHVHSVKMLCYYLHES